MAAALQSCSWRFHLYYCWPGTQLPVWPLPLPLTPERAEAPAGDRSSCGGENTSEGLFSQTFLLPATLIPRVTPATRRERPPFPFKGYPRFVRRLLGAKADLMESGSRAAPLIRVVLPDSFSKRLPRKLDALAAIWMTRTRNLTGLRQTAPQDGRRQTFLVLTANSLQVIQFCLQGTDKHSRAEDAFSCKAQVFLHHCR